MFYTFKQYILNLYIHHSLSITPPTLSWHLTPSLMPWPDTAVWETYQKTGLVQIIRAAISFFVYQSRHILPQLLVVIFILSFVLYLQICLSKFMGKWNGGKFMQIIHHGWAHWALYTALGPVMNLFIRHYILQIESSLTKIEGSPGRSS